MVADRDGRVRYLERLLEVVEAADAVVEKDECWVTGDTDVVCGTCPHCALVFAVDALREEPSQ